MQTELAFPEPRTWGGRRAGSGRKKLKNDVSHVSRAAVSKHDPRLVTLKLASGLPRLRNVDEGDVITRSIRAAQKPTFRIVHYSIQSNHMHLIVETDDRASLANGMKGLTCRLARGLNREWGRRGKVFPKRFHDCVLKSLRQVRNALKYVLNNHLKHAEHASSGGAWWQPDYFSSGRYFDGWLGRPADLAVDAEDAIVAAPCWKIRLGWKRHYSAIAIDEVPKLALY
jgi:REP element-mobilizing transposase RayT